MTERFVAIGDPAFGSMPGAADQFGDDRVLVVGRADYSAVWGVFGGDEKGVDKPDGREGKGFADGADGGTVGVVGSCVIRDLYVDLAVRRLASERKPLIETASKEKSIYQQADADSLLNISTILNVVVSP